MKHTEYQIDWHPIHPRFKFVGVDSNGRKYAYSRKPTVFNDHYKFKNPTLDDAVVFIAQVEPPTENTKCLYEPPLFLRYNTMKLNVKFYFGVSNEIEEVEISAKNVPIERLERIVDDLESGIYEYGLDSNNHYSATFKPLYEYNGAGGQYFSAWQIKKIKCVTVMTKD
jgi:hypothetical protein